jgi:glycosyltransferase involved in cell wall biosynthesis
MKIGLIWGVDNIDSLKYVWASIERALSERHQVIGRPLEYFNSVRSGQRQEILKKLFDSCDILLGHIEEEVLEYREKTGKPISLIGMLFGELSRGGPGLRMLAKYLKTTDILVGNCAADLEITRKFFGNAEIRLLPLAYDESAFYPIDSSRKKEVKASLGLTDRDKVLLYAGRVTLEKNVHTVLKHYSLLQALIPELHLVIAGNAWEGPFREVGVYTFGTARTLQKLGRNLRFEEGRVHVVGNLSHEALCDLYNVADVSINLTLHHDENFGLSQIESMACGTPVIGTKWGGLKDTIVDGETGYHVSTIVTPLGVKVNWLEGVNNICSLLDHCSESERFRRQSREHAVRNYSMEPFRRNLETILNDSTELEKRTPEPVEITSFGKEYWDICGRNYNEPPPYQRGPRSIQLYRELIEPFAGVTSRSFGAREQLTPQSVLCLAAPVQLSEDGKLLINDPIFPFECMPPECFMDAILTALKGLTKEPVITVEKLMNRYLGDAAESIEVITWMLNEGLILGTRSNCRNVNAIDHLSPIAGVPLFNIQPIDFTTDVVVLRGPR